jgi:zinc transport system substrate-binding protein
VRTKIILILTAAALVAAVVAALATGNGGRKSGGGERVVASFYPLAFAAEEIGGAKVAVENLTPPGAEPHDLEVSPHDVRDVQSADLVLLMGRGFQPQLERAAGHGSRVLRLLDTPGLDRFADGDPHVWLDPLRYAKLVARIGRSLGNPAAAGRLATRLRALDREYRRGLADCDRREIVTSHEAFAYLARRYRLRQIAISGLSPDVEPTPATLERVVRLVRQTKATTVYFETLVSPKLARTVAREAGARAAALDPIEGLTPAEAKAGDDYFALIRRNLAALRAGLGCR